MSDKNPHVEGIVDAILNGKPADAAEAFGTALHDVAASRVESARERVETTMFQSVEESVIEFEVDGEAYEISESDYFAILDEDEEVQAFLESVEGEDLTEEQSQQLDELSKNTLGRYINKAVLSVQDKTDDVNNFRREGPAWHDALQKRRKRKDGIRDAVRKLTKEETEK